MFARLVSLDGPEEIPLDRELLLVGRQPICSAQLLSPRVSRLHCSLFRLGRAVLVRDLQSTNGTWINGRRVQQGMLQPGDVLEVGGFRYHFEVGPGDNQGGAREVRSPVRRQVLETTCSA